MVFPLESPYDEDLYCVACACVYPRGRWPLSACPACGGLLEARLARQRSGLVEFRGAADGLWRWQAHLPLCEPAHRVTLGEAGTPLLPAHDQAPMAGKGCLLFKLDTVQPTGSFKDRAAALIVSMARQLGCEGVVLSSSGNAGAAVSAYAARAGLRALVLVPSSVPAGKLLQIRAHGAEVRLVDGTTATASGSPTSGANDLAG